MASWKETEKEATQKYLGKKVQFKEGFMGNWRTCTVIEIRETFSGWQKKVRFHDDGSEIWVPQRQGYSLIGF